MKIFKPGFKKIGMLVLVIWVFGCALPFEWPNPNLEVIVPKEEVMSGWALSPQRDKLFYWASSSSSFILFDSTTQQKRNIDIPCKYFGWLDNTLLWCIDVNDQGSIIPADDLVAIPLQQVHKKETDITELLKQNNL